MCSIYRNVLGSPGTELSSLELVAGRNVTNTTRSEFRSEFVRRIKGKRREGGNRKKKKNGGRKERGGTGEKGELLLPSKSQFNKMAVILTCVLMWLDRRVAARAICLSFQIGQLKLSLYHFTHN